MVGTFSGRVQGAQHSGRFTIFRIVFPQLEGQTSQTSQTDTIESLEDLIDYASPTFGRALSKSFGQSLVRQGTVVAITHDRYFLDNVAGWSLGC